MLFPLLAGCGMLGLAYGSGPWLVYEWLDSQFDLDAAQAGPARRAVDAWFAWNRGTQIDAYADLLAEIRDAMPGEPTADQVCAWGGGFRDRLELAWEHAVPGLAVIASGLRLAQVDHLEAKYRRNDEEFIRRNLDPDLKVRADALLERVVDPLEMLYGRLSAGQKMKVAASLAASSYDPQRLFEERRFRQRDRIASLRRLLAQGAGIDEWRAAIARFGADQLTSPRPDYRAYARALDKFNCASVAEWHASTTPRQRRHAVETLQGWIADLRAIAARKAVGDVSPGARP